MGAMKAYVLCADWGYDGQNVAGVYTSEQAARDAVVALDSDCHPRIYEIEVDAGPSERPVPDRNDDTLVLR
jgi:hypothetical protein